jgi:hypothetical protein
VSLFVSRPPLSLVANDLALPNSFDFSQDHIWSPQSGEEDCAANTFASAENERSMNSYYQLSLTRVSGSGDDKIFLFLMVASS